MLSNLNYLSFLTVSLSLLLNGQVLELPKASELRGTTFVERSTSPNRQTEADLLFQRGMEKFRNNQYKEALEIYKQVLAIRRELGDRQGIAETTRRMGVNYTYLGQYSQAFQLFEESLAICQELADKACQGKTIHEIGKIYYFNGEYPKALEFYRQSLAIYREINDKAGIGSTLISIGLVHENLSQYSQALNFYQQSLAICREINNKENIGRILNNMGIVYTALGKHSQALDLHRQALALRRELKNRSGEAFSLHNIGWAYEQMGNYAKALEYYQQALAIRQKISERAGAARTLGKIGSIYQKLKRYSQAIEVLKQALSISQELGEKAWVAVAFDSIGSAYKGLNQFYEALDNYQKALTISKQVGDRRVESKILSNIGELLAERNQPQLAIVFYKLSVNVTESIRFELRSLSVAQQKSYTATIADTYRRLADLLLQQDRVLEAQQVLDLLKIQELDEYLNNVRGSQQTALGIPLNSQEQQIHNNYNNILNREIQLGRELAELEKISQGDRTAAQQQQIEQLRQIQQEINSKFRAFINSPEITALVQQLSPTAREQNLSLNQLNNLRSDVLRNLQPKAVLLYPLILENRLELVLTTPDAPPIHRTVAVKKTEINQAIVELRTALENPKIDAKVPASKLYNWLIKPIEKDLAQAEAKSIIYAPDGQLRYIPLAALYDGKQWLVQRFIINNITAMSLTKFTRQPLSQPQVLAGAFATGRYNFKMGATPFAFDGLRFAGMEVENIAAIIPGTTKLLDSQFNKTIISRLNDFTIVHMATHAMFVTGQPEDSFILLGDGSRIVLREIQNLSLTNVNLVVLSACQTGIGGKLGNGEEILGFGYQIQQTGAKAAIASLWKVNDGGTQALMTAFYAALQSQNSSLAVALQKAQVALITGDDTVLGESQSRTVQQRTRGSLPAEVAKTLSHPHYWAPFILIGNGL